MEGVTLDISNLVCRLIVVSTSVRMIPEMEIGECVQVTWPFKISCSKW